MRVLVRVLSLLVVAAACTAAPVPTGATPGASPTPPGATNPPATIVPDTAAPTGGETIAPTPVPPTAGTPSPTEPPTTAQPTGGETGAPTPAPTATPTATAAATDVGGVDLVGEDEPGFPGLYLDRGVGVSGSEYGALIVSDYTCEELAGILGAGEWVQTAILRIPTVGSDGSPDPGAPPHAIWLLLERGEESLVAKIGGQPCAGLLTRTSAQTVRASGDVTADGIAQMSQEGCVAAEGQAHLGLLYFGPDDVRAVVGAQVPLKVGRFEPSSLEVRAGRSSITRREFFQEMVRQSGGASPTPDAGEQRELGREYGVMPGRSRAEVEITSVDPLMGTFHFTDLASEVESASLTLSLGFRCDLPSGRLARAAETTPRPTPSPSPPPPPGLVRVDVGSGPFEGVYEFRPTEELSCHEGLLRETHYDVYYSPNTEDPVLGGVFLGVTREGAAAGTRAFEANVFFSRGDDFRNYTISPAEGTGSGTARVTETDGGARFTVSGRARDGVVIEIVIECGRLEQPEG